MSFFIGAVIDARSSGILSGPKACLDIKLEIFASSGAFLAYVK
jgi:hypothetical protein